MKIKKLVTLTAIAVMTGNVWGQTDVTSKYIKNSDFSADEALTVHLCGYQKDISSNQLEGKDALFGSQTVTYWTDNNIKNTSSL